MSTPKYHQFLLKTIKDLYDDHVEDKLCRTQGFLENPMSGPMPAPLSAADGTYYSMADEVANVAVLINADSRLKKISTDDIPALARLLVCYADGRVAFDSTKPIDRTNSDRTGQNNWTNSQANWETIVTGPITGLSTLIATPISDNHSTRKPIQQLNLMENLKFSFQIKPAPSHANPQIYPRNNNIVPIYITETRIATRTGCNSVSNTGFILLSIETDINKFSFEVCSCGKKQLCSCRHRMGSASDSNEKY